MAINNFEKSNIYNFDPGRVEEMLAARNWAGCWEYLGDVIETLTITASAFAQRFGIILQNDMKNEDTKKYINDFGALLGELFLYLLTDESVVLPDKSFNNLIIFHETLHTLFYIYDMDDTDAAVKKILGDGRKKLGSSEQKKLLLLLSLNTELDIKEVLKAVDGRYALPAIIAYLAHRKIFRKNIYNNKIRLYDLRHKLEKSDVEINFILYTTNCYFLCSYLNIPERHKLKENINAGIRNFLETQSRDRRRIKNVPPEQGGLKLDKSKPTVLIAAESFSKSHAMYRCYSQRTGSMARDFNVVFTMAADMADPSLKDDYENFVPFANLMELYQLVQNVQPDIIFMPSIGMRFYNIVLSNLRSAPIQIQSLGHPATTMSEYIDYVLGPDDIYDEKAFPKDKYVSDGFPHVFAPLLTKAQFFAPSVHETPQEDGPKKAIRIGVVGSDIKVSYPFFKILEEIVAEAPFDIHISYMMGVGGIDSIYIEKYLQRTFRNSTYYGWQTYESYINRIKTVDIVLNPFPFGHTNTIIDTLMCGKPCIGLTGVEPSAKTEEHVLAAVGLREKFVAVDEADYKKKFFDIAAQILKGDTVFFDRDKVHDTIFADAGDYDYGRVLKWIYDNHPKLQASDKKYFDVFGEI